MISQKRICASHTMGVLHIFFIYSKITCMRLINKKNIGIFKALVKGFMKCQEPFTHIVEVNNRELKPCIYVMWHSDQFCIYGIEDKSHLSVLISNSIDGEIVAYATEALGFKTVRGSSKKKGAVEATMQMLTRLKNGECVAIMVDGPSGPLHVVKNGAIKLAKLSGAPIVPVCWYSPQFNFVALPSWDKMTTPILDTKILNLYGEPIYIPSDSTPEQDAEYKAIIKKSLEDLQSRIPAEWEGAKKAKLWQKKKQEK